MSNHKATPEQWAALLELLARVEALERNAICPHVRSSDEGTSYCALAEQTAKAKPTPNGRQFRSSLVERVNEAIMRDIEQAIGETIPKLDGTEARAAIRVIADEIEHRGDKGLDLDPGETADWLRRAADPTIQEV